MLDLRIFHTVWDGESLATIVIKNDCGFEVYIGIIMQCCMLESALQELGVNCYVEFVKFCTLLM